MPQMTTDRPEPQSTPAAIPFDTRSDAAETWIAGLPLANVNETCRLMFNALADIEGGKLPPRQRFKLLEMFRRPIQYLRDALNRHFVGVSFPLSPKANKAATLLHGIQLEVAKGYQCIGDELIDVDNLRQDFALLATSLHRALYYLGQGLLTAYQVYRPVTPGLWRSIHRLYHAAERKGLQASPVKDAYPQHDRETTIEAQYKQLLLLALADPNHLPQADIAQVYALLEQWAPRCRLYPATHFDESPNACIVDLEGDAPPVYVAYSILSRHDTCRLLDTSDLIQQLQGLLPHGPSEFPRPLAEPRGQQAAALWKDLLRRLLIAWGTASKRAFSRSAGGSETVKLAFGISTSHQLLGGDTTASDGNASFEHRAATYGREGASPAGAKELIVHSCLVCNESATGACLNWKVADPGKLRVGELLAIRHAHHPEHPWGIAVVRWLKTLGDRYVEFGIQLLAPKAIPAEIRLHSGPESAADYLKCLLLPGLKATRQAPTLIIPAFPCRVDDIVLLKRDGQEHRLRLVKVTESNRIYSRFQFSQER